MIDQATAAAGRWNKEACLDKPLSISINISSRQLSDNGLVDTIAYACMNSGVHPSQVILEITESAMLSDTQATVARLSELRDLGVRLAIDDFGTGYSSLSYLHQFPIEILKIDGSFVKKIAEDKRGSAMARAIISMSETLGLATVGEGIETSDQVERLLGMGCGLGQGYLFSPALSEHEFIGYLRRLNESQEAISSIGVRRTDGISMFSQLRNC